MIFLDNLLFSNEFYDHTKKTGNFLGPDYDTLFWRSISLESSPPTHSSTSSLVPRHSMIPYLIPIDWCGCLKLVYPCLHFFTTFPFFSHCFQKLSYLSHQLFKNWNSLLGPVFIGVLVGGVDFSALVNNPHFGLFTTGHFSVGHFSAGLFFAGLRSRCWHDYRKEGTD